MCWLVQAIAYGGMEWTTTFPWENINFVIDKVLSQPVGQIVSLLFTVFQLRKCPDLHPGILIVRHEPADDGAVSVAGQNPRPG